MSGTKEGGLKGKKTIYAKHGKNFYKNIGRIGGLRCVPKGFAMNPELAKKAGKIGGMISKRGKAKK